MNAFDPSKLDASAQAGDSFETPPETSEEPIGEFVGQATKPTNNTLFVLLALVVLGAGAVLFMRMKTGPKTAAASPEAATANATISQFLTDGNKNIDAMRELLRNTEKVVQQFLDYPSTNQVKLEDLKTNPFRFASEKPTQDTTQADLERQDKLMRQQAIATIQKLKIQTILVSGKNSTCIINNTMYSQGQDVEGLTIEKINPNSLVLAKGKYKFEVKLQK